MASTYERGYSFSGFQSNQPQRPLPAQQLDIELDSIARAIAALWARGSGGGTPGPALDLPIAGLSLKANLLSTPAIPQVVQFEQFKQALGIGSGGGSLPDWNDVQNKPVFGNAAQRNVGASAGTVAAGDDPRIVGALQASSNGSDIPNKGLFRAALGLGAAALLGVGTAAGTVAAGDDPRFNAADVSGKVDKADPQMAAPPFVTFPAPSIVTSVPQSAIDQDGVLNVAHLNVDLTGRDPADGIIQRALDAIGTRIANRMATRVRDGDRVGGVLKFPMGALTRYTQGLTFSADGHLSIIGGTGGNRNAASFRQECPVLFNLTNAAQNAVSGSNMHLELGGLKVVGAYRGCTPFLIREPEAVNIHDIRYSSEGGTDTSGNPLYFAENLFRFRNLRTSFIEKIYARNDHGFNTRADLNGSAFSMIATVGSTDNHFQSMTIQGFAVGFNQTANTYPAIEGTLCENVTLVGVGTGIIFSAANVVYPPGHPLQGQRYIPPQFQYLNGYINAQQAIAVLSNVADFKIADCQLEMHNELGFTDSPAFTLTDVNRFFIQDNFIGQDRPASLIVVAGSSTLGHITNNHGQATGNTGAAIQILNPANNVSTDGNRFTTNGPLWAGDQARGNTNNNPAFFYG